MRPGDAAASAASAKDTLCAREGEADAPEQYGGSLCGRGVGVGAARACRVPRKAHWIEERVGSQYPLRWLCAALQVGVSWPRKQETRPNCGLRQVESSQLDMSCWHAVGVNRNCKLDTQLPTSGHASLCDLHVLSHSCIQSDYTKTSGNTNAPPRICAVHVVGLKIEPMAPRSPHSTL